MITIQIDGKTYRWIGDKWGVDTIKAIEYRDDTVLYSRNGYQFNETRHTPEQLVKLGYMEEVKENKEYNSINEFCVLNGVSEEHRARLNTFLAIEHTKANRIIEKLNNQINSWIAEAESCADTPNIYNDYRVGVLREVLATIKSLSYTEEPLQETIEQVPEFDYEKIEENVRAIEFEKIDECRHIMGHIGHHLELITNYLRKLK